TLPTTHTTTTTVSCSPNPILAGVTSICTATVTDTSTTGATTPTGQVNVNIGNLPSGSCTLSGTAATASCSVPISLPQASIFNIQSFYQGDTTHAASSSSTSLNVTTRPTMTVVTCVDSNLLVNQATSCTATVTDTGPAGSALTPANTVMFSTGNLCNLSGATGSPSASCTVTVTPTSSGQLSISATYNGDNSGHAGSTSNTVTITVNLHATSVAVSCLPGNQVTLIPVALQTVCDVIVNYFTPGAASLP